MNIAEQLQQRIIDANHARQALQIIGNNSKEFYGCAIAENSLPLSVADHTGIIDYQPSELTITARAGTPLTEIISALSEKGQMLAFEPPSFEGKATLGGCIATALAGPRRPSNGSVRDFVIGIRALTGEGKDLRLGGKVMKNVAGYDLFRPMAGALGTLGVMLDITLKLLPLPEREESFSAEIHVDQWLKLQRQWAYASMPISASSYANGKLYLRLSSSNAAVKDAIHKLPNNLEPLANDYWDKLNNQSLDFFDDPSPLYRLIVPGNTLNSDIMDKISGDYLLDWGGNLRWVKSSDNILNLQDIQNIAKNFGGTASVYRNGDRNKDVFMPLDEPLMTLHKRIKKILDPASILNPGRLYREL